MGRPKLELPVAGEPMIRRVVETVLAASFDRVRVVAAAAAELELPDDLRLEVVRNPNPQEGIASSIRCGLCDLPAATEVVAVVLGDMPLVSKDTVRELLRAYEETREPIVFPEYRGRQGHPVLWGREFLGELRKLEGDRGAKALLERNRDRALALAVGDPGVCLDIDTPEDYQLFRGRTPR
jgi:molybdenum cofactor cytidylyltransferase